MFALWSLQSHVSLRRSSWRRPWTLQTTIKRLWQIRGAKKKQFFLTKLEQGFKAVDRSGDGMISEDEFNHMLLDSEFQHHMHALELEPHEGTALFQMLDDGDGQVGFDEFIKGVSRLKGQAKSLDVISIQKDIGKLSHVVRDISNRIPHPAEIHRQSHLSMRS